MRDVATEDATEIITGVFAQCYSLDLFFYFSLIFVLLQFYLPCAKLCICISSQFWQCWDLESCFYWPPSHYWFWLPSDNFKRNSASTDKICLLQELLKAHSKVSDSRGIVFNLNLFKGWGPIAKLLPLTIHFSSPPMRSFYLASQDALEVMLFTDWLTIN